MSPPLNNNNPIMSPLSSSNSNSIVLPRSTSKNVEREHKDTESSKTDSNKIKTDRWTAKQTEVSVTT